MNAKDLTADMPGHWSTPDGLEMAREYADKDRARLCGGQFTDMEVAFKTAMLMRTDMDFEPRLSMAKDRIRWLSVQLAMANADKADLLAALQKIAKGPRFENGEGPEEQCVFDHQVASCALEKAKGAG